MVRMTLSLSMLEVLQIEKRLKQTRNVCRHHKSVECHGEGYHIYKVMNWTRDDDSKPKSIDGLGECFLASFHAGGIPIWDDDN